MCQKQTSIDGLHKKTYNANGQNGSKIIILPKYRKGEKWQIHQ